MRRDDFTIELVSIDADFVVDVVVFGFSFDLSPLWIGERILPVLNLIKVNLPTRLMGGEASHEETIGA